MINCELFSHVHFAVPPIPRRSAYPESLGKFGFRASEITLGLVIFGSGFKMNPIHNSAAA